MRRVTLNACSYKHLSENQRSLSFDARARMPFRDHAGFTAFLQVRRVGPGCFPDAAAALHAPALGYTHAHAPCMLACRGQVALRSWRCTFS